jgi:dihydroflavonol-4-reductase
VELLEALGSICGSRVPHARIPWFGAYLVGTMDNFVMGTLFRREPFIPLEGVKMARYKMYVSAEKARNELDYRVRPVDQALREAVDYFRNVWKPVSTLSRMSDWSTTAI